MQLSYYDISQKNSNPRTKVFAHVDENGITHPINADGTYDLDEGMAVDWIDTDDEWSESLSNEDAKSLDEWLLENNYSVGGSI